MERALKDCAAAVASCYRRLALRGGPEAAMLDSVAASLEAGPMPLARPEPRRLPALGFLGDAVAEAVAGPEGAVAAAFATLEPHLAWVQNPNYSDALMGAGYMDDYAYCCIAGPEGPLLAGDLLLTVLLLGPGRLYPPHAHPAAEVYLPLAGTAAWWQEGEDWREKPPGTPIYHPSGRAHATRVGRTPLLALVAWTGAIREHATLVEKKTSQ